MIVVVVATTAISWQQGASMAEAATFSLHFLLIDFWIAQSNCFDSNASIVAWVTLKEGTVAPFNRFFENQFSQLTQTQVISSLPKLPFVKLTSCLEHHHWHQNSSSTENSTRQTDQCIDIDRDRNIDWYVLNAMLWLARFCHSFIHSLGILFVDVFIFPTPIIKTSSPSSWWWEEIIHFSLFIVHCFPCQDMWVCFYRSPPQTCSHHHHVSRFRTTHENTSRPLVCLCESIIMCFNNNDDHHHSGLSHLKSIYLTPWFVCTSLLGKESGDEKQWVLKEWLWLWIVQCPSLIIICIVFIYFFTIIFSRGRWNLQSSGIDGESESSAWNWHSSSALACSSKSWHGVNVSGRSSIAYGTFLSLAWSCILLDSESPLLTRSTRRDSVFISILEYLWVGGSVLQNTDSTTLFIKLCILNCKNFFPLIFNDGSLFNPTGSRPSVSEPPFVLLFWDAVIQ